jgi:hypothetical protein
MPPVPPPSDDEDSIFSLPPVAPPPLPRPTGNERREWTRAAYVTPIEIIRKGKKLEGRTDDISEGGLSFVTRELFSNDETLIIKVATPFASYAEAFNVTVRWTRSDKAGPGRYVTGVSFLAVTDRARSRIAAYARAFVSENEAADVPVQR